MAKFNLDPTVKQLTSLNRRLDRLSHKVAERNKEFYTLVHTKMDYRTRRRELRGLRKKIQAATDKVNELLMAKQILESELEAKRQERSGWTICDQCGLPDTTGGATCPDCGGECLPYKV